MPEAERPSGPAAEDLSRLDPSALAERPRVRAIRDALRLEGMKSEIVRARRARRRPFAELGGRVLDALEWLGDLRPRARLVGAGGLLAALVLVWIAWNLAPPYVTHFLLQDDIAAVARVPVEDDGVVRDHLRRTIQRRGLEDRLDADRCEVATDPGWRRISCEYAVRVHVLPGVWRTMTLRIHVEQPFLAEPKPLVL